MKKIIILGALLAIAPAAAFADANRYEPITAVPVVKGEKDHYDQKKHDVAKAKHTQKSKEKYVKKIQSKIADTKAFLETKKSTVSAEQLAQAVMKISVAEQWLKTIEGYKDPSTRYVRSVNYALGELKSAKRDMRTKAKNQPASDADVKSGLEELTHLTESTLKEKEGVVFHEENEACFKMMLKSAYDYIELASKPESKNTFKQLTKHARKNLADAKRFSKAHKPQKHTHSSTKLPTHEGTQTAAVGAPTAASASSPANLGPNTPTAVK